MSRRCTTDSACENLEYGKICTYYDQKYVCFAAPITVYNYSFLLSEQKFAKGVPHRKLLVCDEA